MCESNIKLLKYINSTQKVVFIKIRFLPSSFLLSLFPPPPTRKHPWVCFSVPSSDETKVNSDLPHALRCAYVGVLPSSFASLSYLSKQDLSVNLALNISARSAGQQAPGTHLSLSTWS